MVGGAIGIIRSLAEKTGVDLVGVVTKDYANYFYPYIKDQLNLPLREYLKLYRCLSEMGCGKYPLFHFCFVVCYILGERRFDAFTRWIRNALGRSPHFGVAKR